MAEKKYMSTAATTALWAKVKALIGNADWNEDDSTDGAYILNRPAIRAGEGDNSIVEGQIEEEAEAVTYTIYVTGDAYATTYSYTSNETLPSTSLMRSYATVYYENGIGTNKYGKVVSVNSTQNLIIFNQTLSTSALTNEPVKILYRQNGAKGNNSHVEGQYTFSFGVESHAEGSGSIAAAGSAHAEGKTTDAHGTYSHAEGNFTLAQGTSSHAEGSWTVAKGAYSHAEGRYTVANTNQHAFGKYNIEDSNSTYVEIVGNGTADNARSNARTLDWNGNETLAGKLTVGAGPTANMDVATKQYVDSSIPDMSPIVINVSMEDDTYIDQETGNMYADFGYSFSELQYAISNGKQVFFDLSGTEDFTLAPLVFIDVPQNSVSFFDGSFGIKFSYNSERQDKFKWIIVNEYSYQTAGDIESSLGLSINNNVISLEFGGTVVDSITLPVYSGSVSTGGNGS